LEAGIACTHREMARKTRLNDLEYMLKKVTEDEKNEGEG
jgi:hypothetical protein